MVVYFWVLVVVGLLSYYGREKIIKLINNEIHNVKEVDFYGFAAICCLP